MDAFGWVFLGLSVGAFLILLWALLAAASMSDEDEWLWRELVSKEPEPIRSLRAIHEGPYDQDAHAS
jgi:hypothetical protein